MTTAEIITLFQTLVTDEELDSVSSYQLLNQADAQLRMKRPWEILKKLNSSLTRSSGEDYTTTKALPSDFHRPWKLKVGVGQKPLKRINFDMLLEYKDVSGIYAIDYRNSTYAITGPTWAGTIYNWYLYKPARLTSDGAGSTLTTPVFPEDYHPIFAYMMAEIWMGGIDQDERSVAAVPQWIKQYKELWDAMVNWDAELKENDMLPRGYADDDLPELEIGRLGSA